MSDTNSGADAESGPAPIESAIRRAAIRAGVPSASTAPHATQSATVAPDVPPPIHQEPLPASFTLPTQLIEAWLRIPPGEYVEVGLTRGDFDRFYWAITKSFDAQTAFQNSMIDFTNNRTADANVKLREAQRLVIEGNNDLRQLMAAIMAAATVRRPG